jgi:hypothetical protein
MIDLNSVYQGFISAYVLKKVLRYTTHLFYHAYICAPKLLIKSYVLKLHATSTKLKTKFTRLAKNMKKYRATKWLLYFLGEDLEDYPKILATHELNSPYPYLKS